MKIISSFGKVLAVLVALSFSSSDVFAYMDATSLLKICTRGPSDYSFLLCEGYISGIADTGNALLSADVAGHQPAMPVSEESWCIPANTGSGIIIDSVMPTLKSADYLGIVPAYTVVAIALRRQFPCTR